MPHTGSGGGSADGSGWPRLSTSTVVLWIIVLRSALAARSTSGLTLPGGATYRKQVEKSIADAARLRAQHLLAHFRRRIFSSYRPSSIAALKGRQRQAEPPVSKRTFQPNNRRRAKTHGFRLTMRTRAGRAILAGRRSKGRRVLSA